MQIVTSSDHLETYKKFIGFKDTTIRFLKDRGYLELDLPVLSPALVPESYLEVFTTDFGYMGHSTPLFLTPSPELFMKRILSHTKHDCYYLGKAFRNGEPDSSKHSPEFTMLEFYKIGAQYLDIADEVLALLRNLANDKSISYQGKEFKFDHWEKLTVNEAFVRYSGLESGDLFDKEKLRNHAKTKGYAIDGFSYEDIFSQMYVQEVEPHLGTNGLPTLLYDYPKEFAALAKLNADGKTAQRFEFYIAGVELGDCYTELTDPAEQRTRFEQEDEHRKSVGLTNHPVDWGFIEALKHGLPDCSGIAIGFERLAMIFCDVDSIHDLRVVDVV
jgi:EF-P lysine aminoacylase GenX